MPIKTLFRTGVRYPRLGIIRLGVAVPHADPSKRPVPREVDYFVVPPDLAAVVGERPKEIEVSFPSDDAERVFECWYQRYDGPLLAARCDGETCTLIPKEGPEVQFACERPERGPAACPKCGGKALGRLNVIVRRAPTLGVYQVLIGGEGRCRSVMTELKMYERAGLSRNWFALTREPQEVQVRTAEGKRLARQGWPVHVWLRHSPDLVLGPMTPRGALAAAPPDPPDDDDLTDALDDADAVWDISMCYATAASLGLDATTYGAYLARVYRGGVDNMTASQILDQEHRLRAALADPAKREEFVAAVAKVVAAARRMPP